MIDALLGSIVGFLLARAIYKGKADLAAADAHQFRTLTSEGVGFVKRDDGSALGVWAPQAEQELEE